MKKDEVIARLRRLADTMEVRLRSKFLKSIELVRGSVDWRQVIRFLEARDYGSVMALFSSELISSGFTGFSQEITNVWIAGGQLSAVLAQPFTSTSGVRITVSFDVANPELARVLQAQKYRLITQITQDTRQTVHQVMTRNVMEGKNPKETAREIRETVGLTQRQEAAVNNYRRMLQESNRDALGRSLRDRRFDPSIRAAVREEKPLPAEKIDRMVDGYRRKYLRYRSETIARTESIRALNLSSKQLWDSAVQEGKVSEERIRRYWIYTHDSRTRHAHRTIPSLNPDGVSLNGKFKSELGLISYPGDPNASASNTINCRCTVWHKIVGE